MGNLRILVIDDSPSTRRGLIELLHPLRADIEEASNGKEGLAIVESANVDLVITDMDMPGMDGLELCQHLQSHPNTRGIPVIIVSAFDSEGDIDLGFQAGAWAYVSKREAFTELLKTIEEVLSKFSFHRERLILVVDDSRLVCRMVKEGLERAGFQVVTAKNGRIAYELITQRKPDLILSDLDMPVMNGFELCDTLQASLEYNTIPFVVMSTISDRAHIKRIIRRGAVSYIVKPFNMDQMVILVERILSDQFQILVKERERLESERSLMLGSIASLISALEARDPYTRGHSETVAEIVGGMTTLMNASYEEIEMATIGGRLHDIGKIGIRDDILFKPGGLTPQEFDMIKQHPIIGANILKPITSLSDVVSMVLYHHERPDGRGYPHGLTSVPFWASLVSVADIYSALCSKRPYQDPMPEEKVLQIIHDVRGTQLTEESVELFMAWHATKNSKQER
ncbi:response regulator receiver modulated metal dependent phosphohydrolase [Candidatus Moduliflexus flocculans]|uniref:Response regulator receiver modulated metal dependent phosphohydrolase n=1 Tax=Candidatus Moduliflexus flocculans TaxID=1499966 RepID=A0A0S6VWI4_9BACT|nr:response regulator receiver modulated metal dependent phosphohydrolase [Candidatus Moduliflexus flocculans]